MSDLDLSIARMGPASDTLLRNLLKYYMHDMAEWFQFDPSSDGDFPYDTKPVWNGVYDAYLAKTGESLAGFALIGTADEWLGKPGGHDVHEFFVLRRFRHTGIAQRMATFLWDERPGEWIVRVFEANLPAVPFWRGTVASYSHGSYQEERCFVRTRPWVYFRFTAPANRTQ